MSTRPSSRPTRAQKSATASGSRTSNTPVTTRRPSASASCATAVRFTSSRSQSARSAPKRANVSATPRPIPAAAPVISATRSVSSTDEGSSAIGETLSVVPRASGRRRGLVVHRGQAVRDQQELAPVRSGRLRSVVRAGAHPTNVARPVRALAVDDHLAVSEDVHRVGLVPVLLLDIAGTVLDVHDPRPVLLAFAEEAPLHPRITVHRFPRQLGQRRLRPVHREPVNRSRPAGTSRPSYRQRPVRTPSPSR